MNIDDYYSNSFNSFKDNLNLIIPTFVGILLQYALITILFFLIASSVLGSQFFNNILTGTLTTSNLPEFSFNQILVIIILLISGFIGLGLIGSFFQSATIGMARVVITQGQSELDVAWGYGRKYFLRIFLVNIIIGLLFVIGGIPLIIGTLLGSIPLVILGFIIIVIWMIFLFLSFFLISQSIVIGDKPVIDSLKDSLNLFFNNKFTIFLVALINMILSFMISLFIAIILGLIPVIGQILGNVITGMLLTPFFALVMNYLYLDLKNQLPGEEGGS